MKILMVTQFFAPVTGGEERLVADLSTHLAARGHDVSVATMSAPGPSGPSAVRVHHVTSLLGRVPALHSDDGRRHAPPFPDPEAAVCLRRIIAAERPDVLHAHNWLVHSLLPPMGRRRRPLVVTLHDYGLVCAQKRLMRDNRPCEGPALWRCIRCAGRHYGPAKGVPTALLLRPASAALRKHADIFLPVSQAVADRSGLAAAGLPYEVIPNFVADDLLDDPGPQEDPDGLPPGDFIVFAGDLVYDKGIQTLLRAHAALPAAPPLVLVGRSLPQQPLPPSENVVVLPPHPHGELMRIFRRSLAVVVPSIWTEPFGLVALEAMATGRPVIASRVGGLAHFIEHEVTGLLTAPGDDAGLADAMRRLVASPALRERLGRAGRRRAGAFSASAVVPRIEEVYRRLVGDGRRLGNDRPRPPSLAGRG
jgi:glycosyltransferase involved in cell wall biosynthesis